MSAWPLLTWVLALPLLGGVLVWLWPKPAAARHIALATLVLTLVASLVAAFVFDSSLPGFQMAEKHAWIPSLGIHYHIAVDGLSVFFLPATVLLFVGVVLASWTSVHTLTRLYYSLLLLLATASLGVFVALDTILFFLFWELTLIPLYFLVTLWGVGPQRRHAATKYTLVMLAGGVALLFALMLLALGAPGDALVFDLPTLLALPQPEDVQRIVFLLFLLGFGTKVPLVPLHTWLPLIAMEGPAAVVALLTGLKLGAYGLIRFAVPLAPAAAGEFHWLLVTLGTATLLFGATVALAQTNLRRMLGYASLSHVGLVVLGIATLNLQGLQGAVLLLLNFTLASGGLFLMTSYLHHRTGTTDIAQLGGVAQRMPWLAACFLVCGLAGMGMPGTPAFPAELMILIAVFESHAGAGMVALAAVVLGAAYFAGIYRRIFFGMPRHPVVQSLDDLRPRELGFALVLVVLVLATGFWPGALLEALRPSAVLWAARLG